MFEVCQVDLGSTKLSSQHLNFMVFELILLVAHVTVLLESILFKVS
jgi:hypothetical protein